MTINNLVRNVSSSTSHKKSMFYLNYGYLRIYFISESSLIKIYIKGPQWSLRS